MSRPAVVGSLVVAVVAAGVLVSTQGTSQPPAEAASHSSALRPDGARRAASPAQLRAARLVPSDTVAVRRSLAQRLSLNQLAGQRVIYAYAGLKPPASLLAVIRAGEAAGVIFYGPNISSLSQIRAVVRELVKASASSPVHAPLLMLTDQEGGEVRRLPGAPVLSEKQIGESANAVALAAAAGVGAGRNLAGVGMNVNLAPVLDVFRQPGNFVDEFQRSYAPTPAIRLRSRGSGQPSSQPNSAWAWPPPRSTSPASGQQHRARIPTSLRSRSPLRCRICAQSMRLPIGARSPPV